MKQLIALEERRQLRSGRRGTARDMGDESVRFQIGAEHLTRLIPRVGEARDSVLWLSHDSVHLHRFRNGEIHFSPKQGHGQHLEHVCSRKPMLDSTFHVARWNVQEDCILFIEMDKRVGEELPLGESSKLDVPLWDS